MQKKSPNQQGMAMTKVRTSSSLLTLKYNNSFCNKFFEKNKIASVVEEPEYFSETRNLVYDVSKSAHLDSEYFQVIVDLLLQLRATQNDQNIFVQNNTVLREQILNQLKSEVLKVSHKLSLNQIKNLEVLSNNNFDGKTLTDILNSFLRGSKKKFAEQPSLANHLGFRFKPSEYILRNLESKNTKLLDVVNKRSETFNKLINYVNSKQVIHTSTDLVNLSKEETAKPDKVLRSVKSEKSKKLADRKSVLKNYTEVKQLYDLLGDNIIAKSQLILPLIKLRVKLSEINLLSKTRLIANDVVNKTVSKVLPSETQLINKVIENTNLTELKEKLIYNQEQYENFKLKYQTEVKKVHNYFKKFQADKTLVTSKNYELKTNQIISQNVQNEVRKNINKFTYQNQVYRKIENISETAVKNYVTKNLVQKDKLIYDIIEKQTQTPKFKTIYNKKILPRKVTLSDEYSVIDLNQKNVGLSEIRNRYFENVNVLKNSVDLINQVALTYKTTHRISDILKLKSNYDVVHNEYDDVLRFKNFNYELKKRFDFQNYAKLQEFVNVFNEEKLSRKKLTSEKISKSVKNFRDIVQTTSLIKNRRITTENLNFIHNLNLMDIPVDESRFAEKSQIHRVNNLFSSFYDDTSHMVYKQNILPKIQEKKENPKPKAKVSKELDYTIKEVPKPVAPVSFNEKEFEKKIMANTLGKKEILDLIKSQLSSINLEDISQTVLSRVESQLLLDRKRNGIF